MKRDMNVIRFLLLKLEAMDKGSVFRPVLIGGAMARH